MHSLIHSHIQVINRGGETISPFEIEEACQGHPYIKEVLCFSAPNEQYQESIGVVVVRHAHKPRIDLVTLHAFLEERLHRSKWPQVVVFSDKGLPKNATGEGCMFELFFLDSGADELNSLSTISFPVCLAYNLFAHSLTHPLTTLLCTGKILRIKFAERTNMTNVDEESAPHTRYVTFAVCVSYA